MMRTKFDDIFSRLDTMH